MYDSIDSKCYRGYQALKAINICRVSEEIDVIYRNLLP